MISISKKYSKIIPQQTLTQYDILKHDIEQNDQRDPIIINKKGIIIDGHTRFKICQELGIKPKFKTIKTEKTINEIDFIKNIELTRRKLTEYQYNYLLITKAKSGDKFAENLIKEIESGKRKDPNSILASKGSLHRTKKIMDYQEIHNEAWLGKITNEEGYKEVMKIKKQKQREEALRKYSWGLPENFKIYNGKFQDVSKEIPQNRIDCIITDPPYPTSELYLYKELGEFAQKHLKEGGSLVAYSGQTNLPKVINLLLESGLKYWWVFALRHTSGHQSIHDRRVFADWKPALWFVKGEKSVHIDYVSDFIETKGTIKKTEYAWQQDPMEAKILIEKLTIKNSLVCDPFLGVGTTGVASLELNRKFIGIEENKERYEHSIALLGAMNNGNK